MWYHDSKVEGDRTLAEVGIPGESVRNVFEAREMGRQDTLDKRFEWYTGNRSVPDDGWYTKIENDTRTERHTYIYIYIERERAYVYVRGK